MLLLADCFTTYNEPEIGKAAVQVLERAGYAVELADVACCGRTLISKGFLHETRALVAAGAAPALARRLADGTPLLGLEPSCLLTLVDEWTELVPGPETRRIAAASDLADGWLAAQVESGRCKLDLHRCPGKCVVHGHCHQKALVGTGGTAAALRLMPGLEVSVARHRLLRHGRLVRLREGPLRPEREDRRTCRCCRPWPRRRTRRWRRPARRAGTRSMISRDGERCTRWK